MTRRAKKGAPSGVAARREFMRGWYDAPDKTAYSRARGVNPTAPYQWRKKDTHPMVKVAEKYGPPKTETDDLHGFLKAAEAHGRSGTATLVEKLRADNDLLRELLRRAIANGFLKDLLP